MTAPLTTLYDALYQMVIDAGSNERVIFYYQGKPRPELPFTSIQFLNQSAEVDDWMELNKTTDQTELLGYREQVYTITCHGELAWQEAVQLQAALLKQSIRDLLRTYQSASILNAGAVTDISDLVNGIWEERSTFDLTLLVNMEDGSTTDDLGYFETVEPIEWTNKP